MLTVDDDRSHYGAAQALRRRQPRSAGDRQDHLRDGRNGVGKTSPAARHCRPAGPISKGGSIWDGETSPACRPARARQRGIAYVPQGREIFPLLT
jgi:urea transport system ATP-binding protein